MISAVSIARQLRLVVESDIRVVDRQAYPRRLQRSLKVFALARDAAPFVDAVRCRRLHLLRASRDEEVAGFYS